MAERERSRTTRLVWWATVVAMLVIAGILLLAFSPWNDPLPYQLRKELHQTQNR